MSREIATRNLWKGGTRGLAEEFEKKKKKKTCFAFLSDVGELKIRYKRARKIEKWNWYRVDYNLEQQFLREICRDDSNLFKQISMLFVNTACIGSVKFIILITAVACLTFQLSSKNIIPVANEILKPRPSM